MALTHLPCIPWLHTLCWPHFPPQVQLAVDFLAGNLGSDAEQMLASQVWGASVKCERKFRNQSIWSAVMRGAHYWGTRKARTLLAPLSPYIPPRLLLLPTQPNSPHPPTLVYPPPCRWCAWWWPAAPSAQWSRWPPHRAAPTHAWRQQRCTPSSEWGADGLPPLTATVAATVTVITIAAAITNTVNGCTVVTELASPPHLPPSSRRNMDMVVTELVAPPPPSPSFPQEHGHGGYGAGRRAANRCHARRRGPEQRRTAAATAAQVRG